MIPKQFLLLPLLALNAAPMAQEEPKADALPSMAVARLGTTRFKAGIGIRCLALSPDGRTLAVGPAEAARGRWMPLRLWDAATGKELRTFDDDRGHNSLSRQRLVT